jgi:hypothetical protein
MEKPKYPSQTMVVCGRRVSVRSFGIACLVCVALIYFVNMMNNSGEVMKVVLRKDDSLTVLINTFKRHEQLEASVKFYTQCPLVKHIAIVWSESDPPPESMSKRYAKSQSPVISFEIHETDSLNNRFMPLKSAHSDAIFSVDDDMKIPCEELALAYQVWKGSSRSIVGWMPRMHIRGSDHQLIYRCWWRVWWHGYYSIILTKAAIIHHDYLDLYTNKMSQSIRDMVDQNRNCEDIAMQFLISDETKLPPIYVKGHLGDSGALGGISTNQNVVTASHMDARSQCLNDLAKIYGHNPLINSNFIVDSAANGWTNEPSTWWEYISSDLWNWF